MQRFSPKAFSVLEKKIFKGFYHIWAWRPSWSTDRDNFSNLLFPHTKVAPYEIWTKLAQRLQRISRLKLLTIFPFKCIDSYKCIGKRTWPCRKKVKRQRTTILLAPLVDLSSPMIHAKIQPQRHPRLWRRRFLKVFTIYGHGGHLGQRTMTVLAIFCFPTLRWIHMKFEQN